MSNCTRTICKHGCMIPQNCPEDREPSALPIPEPQGQSARSSRATCSALTQIKMALRFLEEIEPTVMHAKRRKIPNFNEHSERETLLSAARISLDSAITLLEHNDALSNGCPSVASASPKTPDGHPLGAATGYAANP